MRRTPLAIALLAVMLVTGACSASAPGWTYAPPTPSPAVTPAPSGAPSAAPAGPTPVATLAPSGAAPSGAGTPTVDISALNVEFEQKEISVPADVEFVIRFDNKDMGVQHNVEIKDASGKSLFMGDIIVGMAQVEYRVPALPAGTYQFVCTVHMNMVGTLTVGG
jgi:plastocyanin